MTLDPPRSDRPHAVTPAIELVLAKAAGDDAFRALLFADRLAAVEAAGVSLSPLERSMLTTVPEPQLRALIEALPPLPPLDPRLPELAFTGINPDLPDPRYIKPPAGVRPDRPIAWAAALALGAAAAGGAYYYHAMRGDAAKDGAKPPVEEPAGTPGARDAGPEGPRK